MNSDNLSKNTNRSIMIMLRRIKTEFIITISLNDTQKSYQEFYSDLKHNDPDLPNTLKLGK